MVCAAGLVRRARSARISAPVVAALVPHARPDARLRDRSVGHIGGNERVDRDIPRSGLGRDDDITRTSVVSRGIDRTEIAAAPRDECDESSTEYVM
jgi:hypothetical protein